MLYVRTEGQREDLCERSQQVAVSIVVAVVIPQHVAVSVVVAVVIPQCQRGLRLLACRITHKRFCVERAPPRALAAKLRPPSRSWARSRAGYQDWLGLPVRERPPFLPFEEARAFVHALGLRSEQEWRDWRCKQGNH